MYTGLGRGICQPLSENKHLILVRPKSVLSLFGHEKMVWEQCKCPIYPLCVLFSIACEHNLGFD